MYKFEINHTLATQSLLTLAPYGHTQFDPKTKPQKKSYAGSSLDFQR